MDLFKLDSKFKPVQPDRNCGNCGFAAQERMPQQIATSLVCHAGPPSVIAIPSAGGNFQALVMFPVMQPQQFCFTHRYISEILGPEIAPSANANSSTDAPNMEGFDQGRAYED